MVSWAYEVLPQECYRGLETVEFLAIKIKCTECEKILKQCSNLFPLPMGFRHLKRVKPILIETYEKNGTISKKNGSLEKNKKKTSHVLILVGQTQKEGYEVLEKLVPKSQKSIFLQQVKVPKEEPLTWEQYKQWSALWPVMFYRPAWECLLFHSEEAVRIIIKNMLEKTLKETSLTNPICCNSCVICWGQTIIASAKRPTEMLHDTDMNKNQYHPLYVDHVTLQALARLSYFIRSLKSTTSVFTDSDASRISSKKQISSSCNIKGSVLVSELHDQNNSKIVGFKKKTSSLHLPKTPDALFLDLSPPVSSQYYATGCVAYLSQEPCVMCSMALLHNRVSVVVYPKGTQNTIFGGLGGCISLHANAQLNHRFHVLVVDFTKL